MALNLHLLVFSTSSKGGEGELKNNNVFAGIHQK
jgi:hypothetical protein